MEGGIKGLQQTIKAKHKVRASDIQENIHRLQSKLEKTPVGTTEYDMLSRQLEHEYVVLKKYKDSKFYIAPKDWLTIGSVGAMVVFFTCLEREVPSATKFANLVLKFVPFKG